MVTLTKFVDDQFNDIIENINVLINDKDIMFNELIQIYREDLTYFYINRNKESFDYKLTKFKEMLTEKKIMNDKLELMLRIFGTYKDIKEIWYSNKNNEENIKNNKSNKIHIDDLFKNKNNFNYVKIFTNSDMKLIKINKITEDLPLNVRIYFHNNVYQNLDIFKKRENNCLRLYYGNNNEKDNYGNSYIIEEKEKFISYNYDKKINYIGYQLVYCDEDKEM